MYRLLLLLLPLGSALLAQTIATSAADSTWGRLRGIALDSAGNQYASDFDSHVVYRIDRFGAYTIVAGQRGTPGFGGDGGPATRATLNQPHGLAVAPDGTIYVADLINHRVRRIAANGTITTYAGDGNRRFAGDGGPAAQASLYEPWGLALDAAGNLFIADSGNYRVRRVTPAGIVSTVAGNGSSGLSGDGGQALLANVEPLWLAIGLEDSLYISNRRSSFTPARVRRRAANGVITSVAGNGTREYSGDGGAATSAGLVSTDGIGLDRAGNLYIAEEWGARVRRVSLEGIITTVAGSGRNGSTGDGGPASNAQVRDPVGVAVDADGSVYFTEPGRIRRISPPAGPSISATNAAVPAFLGRAGFTSNSYLEIYGSNLSETTRTWSGSDFNGSNAPTSLDGVSVTVNGRPAFVFFVSPNQINVNAPEDTATGPVNIQVRNALGASNIGVANRMRVAPTLHSIPQFSSGGRPHVVAQTTDFRSFIGNPGMVNGVQFAPARTGQTVIVYGLGCGPTNPSTTAGVTIAANSPLALPYEVRIGGQRANVAFAGAVANTIGLYQFNVVVPEVASGDQPIELTVDGVGNNQGLYIAIVGATAPPVTTSTTTYAFASWPTTAKGQHSNASR